MKVESLIFNMFDRVVLRQILKSTFCYSCYTCAFCIELFKKKIDTAAGHGLHSGQQL